MPCPSWALWLADLPSSDSIGWTVFLGLLPLVKCLGLAHLTIPKTEPRALLCRRGLHASRPRPQGERPTPRDRPCHGRRRWTPPPPRPAPSRPHRRQGVEGQGEYTMIKNKIKFSAYIRKFRMEQLQSNLRLTASSYMVKYLHISSYIRKPFHLYDFATALL